MEYITGIYLNENTISCVTLDHKKNIVESKEFNSLDNTTSKLQNKKCQLSIALGADLFSVKIIPVNKKLAPKECDQIIKRTITSETHYYHYELDYQSENYKIIIFYAEKKLIDKLNKTFRAPAFRLVRIQPEITPLLKILPDTKNEQIILRPQTRYAVLYYINQGMLQSWQTINSPSELKTRQDNSIWFIENSFGINKYLLKSMKTQSNDHLNDNLFIAKAIASGGLL